MAHLAGCAQTNSAPDAPHVDAIRYSGRCSPRRSATVILIANRDTPYYVTDDRRAVTLDLLGRLLAGDADGDGASELTGMDSIRFLMLSNELEDTRDFSRCRNGVRGAFLASTCGSGGPVQTIRATDATWMDEVRCRIADVPDEDLQCVPEPIETALVALSPDPAPVDLRPRSPLGSATNAVFREVEDVLVVIMEAGEERDDCSLRLRELAPCEPETVSMSCCDPNTAPITRAAGALRAIVGDRPTVFVSLGMHPTIDPSVGGVAAIDAFLDSPTCYLSPWDPHRRMARLARELHPDMHLITALREPTDCGYGQLDGLVRAVFERVCD